jgi:hypothetical protein
VKGGESKSLSTCTPSPNLITAISPTSNWVNPVAKVAKAANAPAPAPVSRMVIESSIAKRIFVCVVLVFIL